MNRGTNDTERGRYNWRLLAAYTDRGHDGSDGSLDIFVAAQPVQTLALLLASTDRLRVYHGSLRRGVRRLSTADIIL
jgi:hypothetical protein